MSGNGLVTFVRRLPYLSELGITRLEQLAAEGRYVADCCDDLGLTKSQLHRLLRRQAEAKAAYDTGRARCKRSPASDALVRVHPSVLGSGTSIEVRAAGLDTIRALAERGATISAIAASLGLKKRELQELIDSSPDVHAAYEQARARLEHRITANLLRLSDSGCVASSIFLAKNYCQMSDHGPTGGRANQTNVVINLPDARSESDYLRSLNIVQTNGEDK